MRPCETVLAFGKLASFDLDLLTETDSPDDVIRQVPKAMIEGVWLELKEETARKETRLTYQKEFR